MTIHTCRMDTPLGPATVSAKNNAIAGFWFIGQKYYPPKEREWDEDPDYPVFAHLRQWLDAYFAGKRPSLDFPLEPDGSPFRKAVWDILLAIPYGELTTYGAISRQMATAMALPSMSAQAVGGAVGHNPISLVIPCHRVVGTSGSLTGYAGGLDKKKALLRLEGIPLPGERGSLLDPA